MNRRQFIASTATAIAATPFVSAGSDREYSNHWLDLMDQNHRDNETEETKHVFVCKSRADVERRYYDLGRHWGFDYTPNEFSSTCYMKDGRGKTVEGIWPGSKSDMMKLSCLEFTSAWVMDSSISVDVLSELSYRIQRFPAKRNGGGKAGRVFLMDKPVFWDAIVDVARGSRSIYSQLFKECW